MRTTINIHDALLAELKEQARVRGRPLREVVNATLRRGLAAVPVAAKPPHLPAYAVGIKPAYRGLSLNQLYDQIESEETLQVAEP